MSKARVLIADDDPLLSRLVRAILERSGSYEVMEVNQALSVLPTAKRFKPDVLLLDINMPGKDGGEIAHDIRSDPFFQDTQILFLSSLVSREQAGQKEMVSGGNRFLSKPVDPDVLINCLARMLGNSGTPETQN